jgi:hypothetical protein
VVAGCVGIRLLWLAATVYFLFALGLGGRKALIGPLTHPKRARCVV